MFIAVTSEGKDFDSQVSAKFETCKYLLIVDMESQDIKAIENTSVQPGEDLAQKIIDNNCEALITGKMTAEVFEILADACVTRYIGFGYSVKDSLVLMDQHKLKLIRNTEGTDDCDGNHHEDSCDTQHHD